MIPFLMILLALVAVIFGINRWLAYRRRKNDAEHEDFFRENEGKGTAR